MASRRFDWYRAFVKDTSRLVWYIIPLIILSICDVLVTYKLLSTSLQFYESNPVANWLFTRFDFAGMIMLKFGGVALAIIIAEYVEYHRPGLGKFILLFGIAITLGVVIYGVKLYLYAPLA
jgi:hypothetical protein